MPMTPEEWAGTEGMTPQDFFNEIQAWHEANGTLIDQRNLHGRTVTMPDNTQHVFNVQLVIKGDSRYRAYTELAKQLNDWFVRDAFKEAPYPEGSLLLWSTKEEE